MLAPWGISRPTANEATTLRYDSAPERRRAILSAVGDTGFVSVTELTRRLGVSDMTVRRDLRKLAQQGTVRIVHGGVSALSTSPHSPAFTGRAEEHATGKRAIGEAVARSLSLRATIAVDAGTTTYAVVQALPDSFRGTVVTHSIPVMQLMLSPGTGTGRRTGGRTAGGEPGVHRTSDRRRRRRAPRPDAAARGGRGR